MINDWKGLNFKNEKSFREGRGGEEEWCIWEEVIAIIWFSKYFQIFLFFIREKIEVLGRKDKFYFLIFLKWVTCGDWLKNFNGWVTSKVGGGRSILFCFFFSKWKDNLFKIIIIVIKQTNNPVIISILLK